MKRIIYILGCLLIYLTVLLLCGSCSLEKQIFKNEPYVRQLLGVPDSIVINHDSIVEVELSVPDSGYLNAYFECNDSNQVLMKRYESLKSKGVQTIVKFVNNTLHFDFKTDSIRIAKSIIERFSQVKTKTIEVDKPSTLKELAKLEEKNAYKSRKIWILLAINLITFGIIYLNRKK